MRYGHARMALAGTGAALVAVLAGCGGGDTTATDPQAGSPTGSPPETSSAEPTSPTSPSPSSSPTATPGSTTTTSERSGGDSAQDADYCHATDVKVSLGKGNATAGSYYAPLRFTNTGDDPCVIAGYPGVSYVAGEDPHQVGPAAERVGSNSPAVTLSPGEVAHATVRFLQVHNYPENACEPTHVRAVRVYPPGETASTLVPHSGTGCTSDAMSGPQLTVKPVRPGPG